MSWMGKRCNELFIKYKNDWMLIGLLICIASIFFITLPFLGSKGEYVNVTVDGMQFANYPLKEDLDTTIRGFQTGRLHLKIEGGYVSVSQSSCPDLLCVHHRKIGKTGESIICLPNRVVIEIMGHHSNEPDAVTK